MSWTRETGRENGSGLPTAGGQRGSSEDLPTPASFALAAMSGMSNWSGGFRIRRRGGGRENAAVSIKQTEGAAPDLY